MFLEAFQRTAVRTNERGGKAGSRTAAIYGMVGETGSVASVFKKRIIYPSRPEARFRDELREELGDVLWYLSVVSAQYGLNLDSVGRHNLVTITNDVPELRKKVCNLGSLTFDAYQDVAIATDRTKQVEQLSLGLIRNVGESVFLFRGHDLLLRKYGFKQNRSIESSLKKIRKKLGDILWYLALLAHKHGLTLEVVVTHNVEKTESLQAVGEVHDFDGGFEEDQRFPRTLSIHFVEGETEGPQRITLKINGVIVGDRLTDNAHTPDDYRYHDVFHLAYMAVLGWSPVMRALLKRKRRDDPKIDENEDGARAAIIEEAIALYIFNLAKGQWNFFDGVDSVDIGILKTVLALCSELEVGVCTAKQWQRAILEGYKVWNLLRANHGGIVDIDLDAAQIGYRLAHENENSGVP